MINMGYKEGRSELAPEVHAMTNKQKCTRFNSTSVKIPRKMTHTNKKEDRQQSESNANYGNCICGCEGCWLFCKENPRA